MYSGFVSTLLREAVGLGVYFTTYDILMSKLNADGDAPALSTALLAGGISGVLTWTAMYPLDFVKTLIQSDSIEKPRHRGMLGYFQ